MKIIYINEGGFCFGVRRAIKIAENNPGSVIIGGEIIHNADEVARLKNDFGVIPQENGSYIAGGQTAIIRAHGIPKEMEQELRDRGVIIKDATCPNVKELQCLVEKFSIDGFHIILVGAANHPEVIGVLGYAHGTITVVENLEDIENIKTTNNKIAIFAQTTANPELFRLVYKKLCEKYRQVTTQDTICKAISIVQSRVAEIAKQIANNGIFIVVGGKNSSNTKVLAQIAGEHCETYHIQTADDLKREWFNGVDACGLVAGSSTPSYVINNVKSALENL